MLGFGPGDPARYAEPCGLWTLRTDTALKLATRVAEKLAVVARANATHMHKHNYPDSRWPSVAFVEESVDLERNPE